MLKISFQINGRNVCASFHFWKMLTYWANILSVYLRSIVAHWDKKLFHLKHFGPRYNPTSSHVANCRVASCPNPISFSYSADCRTCRAAKRGQYCGQCRIFWNIGCYIMSWAHFFRNNSLIFVWIALKITTFVFRKGQLQLIAPDGNDSAVRLTVCWGCSDAPPSPITFHWLPGLPFLLDM